MADGKEIVIEAQPQSQALASALPATPMEMLSRALERGADISILDKLMDLQERHEKNEGRKAFDEAMSLAKAEIPTIVKNRKVDFTTEKGGRTNYAYEDLAQIAETVSPILSKYGLSYRYRTSSLPNESIVVTCVVSHRLGYSEENTLHGPRDESGKKNSIQAIGSTLTYLQRMTLKAALGLAAAADDDGASSETQTENDLISDEQLAAIQKLIDDTGADTERLCKYFKIEALPDIRKNEYANVIAAIEAAAKKKAAK